MNISDHLAVWVNRKRQRERFRKIEFKGSSYRNFIKEDFQEGLIHANLEEFYKEHDPNLCWDITEKIIRDKLNEVCPQRIFRVREVREPWVTDEILEEIKHKDILLELARNSGKRDEWEYAKRERNRVGRLVQNARADFVKDQQRELRGDPKKFWKAVSSIVPAKKKVQGNIVIEHDGIELRGKDSAGFINNFF